MAFNKFGLQKDMNFPESGGGETNGLYAAVTNNEIPALYSDDASSYFDDYSPTILDTVSGIVDQSMSIYNRTRQQIAAAKLPQRPPASAQWNSLTIWQQLTFTAVAGGLAFLLLRAVK